MTHSSRPRFQAIESRWPSATCRNQLRISRTLVFRLRTAVRAADGAAFRRTPTRAGAIRILKVIAPADGRISAFIFDQTASRVINYCDGRTSIKQVVLRSHLTLFRMADAAPFRSLDAEVGCTIPASISPAPSVIPVE
jgi:endonuclease G